MLGETVKITLVDGQLSLTLKTSELDFTVGISLHEYTYQPQKNEQISDLPDAVTWYNEYGIHSPGKYIFTTTMKEPALLIPDTVTYSSDSKGDGCTVNLNYLHAKATVVLQYLPFAHLHEKISVRIVSGPLVTGTVDQVIRYSTNIKNEKTFYTDSNGLYAMKRTAGEYGRYRECNYYPLTRFMYLEDHATRATVLVDRTEGGTVPAPGVLEVMFNRKSDSDDSRGVAEVNNEGRPINVLHHLVFENLDPSDPNKNLEFRKAQIEMDSPLLVIALKPKVEGMKFRLKTESLIPNGKPGVYY